MSQVPNIKKRWYEFKLPSEVKYLLGLYRSGQLNPLLLERWTTANSRNPLESLRRLCDFNRLIYAGFIAAVILAPAGIVAYQVRGGWSLIALAFYGLAICSFVFVCSHRVEKLDEEYKTVNFFVDFLDTIAMEMGCSVPELAAMSEVKLRKDGRFYLVMSAHDVLVAEEAIYEAAVARDPERVVSMVSWCEDRKSDFKSLHKLLYSLNLAEASQRPYFDEAREKIH